jgi:putative transposase
MLNWRAAAQFSSRHQSAKRYVYVRADGIYLQARLEREKQCILALATTEGSGAVKARKAGAVCRSIWARLNVRPELAIADGARKAAGEIHLPAAAGCTSPRTCSAGCRRPSSEIWIAETKADAEPAFEDSLRATR